jgi:hypothetical protein
MVEGNSGGQGGRWRGTELVLAAVVMVVRGQEAIDYMNSLYTSCC